MPPRLHVDGPLSAGQAITLPPGASRHVQVLRLQPGDAVTLFDGRGGQWQAELLDIGRKLVQARLLAHQALDCELRTPVTLALGMPANERMDSLVEKATELGVAAIVPLLCERSVLRLAGERAERRQAHWQAVAVAACEQSGRNRVPLVHAPQALRDWLQAQAAGDGVGEDVLAKVEQARLGQHVAQILVVDEQHPGSLSHGLSASCVRGGVDHAASNSSSGWMASCSCGCTGSRS